MRSQPSDWRIGVSSEIARKGERKQTSLKASILFQFHEDRWNDDGYPSSLHSAPLRSQNLLDSFDPLTLEYSGTYRSTIQPPPLVADGAASFDLLLNPLTFLHPLIKVQSDSRISKFGRKKKNTSPLL